MAGEALEGDNHPRRAAAANAVYDIDGIYGAAGEIMVGENLGNPRFFHQRRTFRASFDGFFRVLEYKIDIFIRPFPVNFHGKPGQTRAVAVMAAFMGNPGELGAIGQGYGFVYWQGIKICPEGNGWFVRAGPVHRVKPGPPVNHIKGGMLLKKINQPLLRPYFLTGQLRMLMQFMAERYRKFQIIFIHIVSSFSISQISPKFPD
jgi:hypothetical protein